MLPLCYSGRRATFDGGSGTLRWDQITGSVPLVIGSLFRCILVQTEVSDIASLPISR